MYSPPSSVSAQISTEEAFLERKYLVFPLRVLILTCSKNISVFTYVVPQLKHIFPSKFFIHECLVILYLALCGDQNQNRMERRPGIIESCGSQSYGYRWICGFVEDRGTTARLSIQKITSVYICVLYIMAVFSSSLFLSSLLFFRNDWNYLRVLKRCYFP